MPPDSPLMEDKPLVLILCTGNSCRSQMAEAILRSVAGDVFEVASAGADPSDVCRERALARQVDGELVAFAVGSLDRDRDLAADEEAGVGERDVDILGG